MDLSKPNDHDVKKFVWFTIYLFIFFLFLDN